MLAQGRANVWLKDHRPGDPTRSAAQDREVLKVRIGLDMLAVQSPHHGARGIGRYSANLVSSLLAREDGHQYTLYVHDGLSLDRLPSSMRTQTRILRNRAGISESSATRIDRVARENADKLDALLILSPFEYWDGYTPPARPDNGLKLVSVVYDLIPFLFQNERAVDPVLLRQFKTLEKLKAYDALLAISDCTRNDVLSLLRMSPDRVINVSGASDPSFFRPAEPAPIPDATKDELARLGIHRPFVFNVGGLDERKNHYGLIDAFAALPERLRTTHQLVFTFMVTPYWYHHLRHYAIQRGVGDSIVLTGEIDDSLLRMLYQRCEAFVFPSLYEGFGLPILEAMHCGAAVVAGNNSSQIEVLGDAGLLAEATDSNDIAAKIATILDDPILAKSLRARAVVQAATFSWERTGGLALETIAAAVERPRRGFRLRIDRGHRRKPTIAFLSPLPPRKSGISDYSALLLDELRMTYNIDLYHDRGYVPEPALGSDEYMSCDARQFERVASLKNYHAIVYQMGNSRYHNFMYPIMMRHRGLVMLHDFCLAGFFVEYGHALGRGTGLVRDELLRWYPADRQEILEALAEWGDDSEAIQRGCARRGWWLNKAVLDASQVTLVHSPWCEAKVKSSSPEYLDRVKVIPFGIHPRRVSAEERAAIRDRFFLPRDAFLVASFGFVHAGKLCAEAVDAFSGVARDDPKAIFLFVGGEADDGMARRRAANLGIADRVRFLGRQPMEAFDALMNVTDLGVNLRMPPTNGETSAALLNLLASGVATVVTDVDTFSDFSSKVVRKVLWDADGPDDLARAIEGLAADRVERQSLAKAAWNFVHERHEWSQVARHYVDAIERCHRELAKPFDRDESSVRPAGSYPTLFINR